MELYNFCCLSILYLAANTVFADLPKDIEVAMKCVESQHISTEEISNDIMECYKEQLGVNSSFLAISSAEDIVKTACSIKDAKACLLEHTEVIRQTCFNAPSLKKEIDKVMRQFDAIFQYACNDGGKRVIEFLKNRGIFCVSQLFSEADNKTSTCLNTHLQSNMKELEAAGDNAEKYQELQCSMMNQIKSCVIDRMTSCTKPRDLLDGLFREIVKASDCSKYLPASSDRIQVPYILMFLSSSLLMLLCHP